MNVRLAMLVMIPVGMAFSVPPANQKGRPIGMILRSKGDVVVERSGQKRPGQLADLLYAEDTVLTVSGEVSVLFCPASTTYRLGDGSSLKLAKEQVLASGDSVESAPSSRKCSLPEVALGAESLERAGAIRVRSSGLPTITLFHLLRQKVMRLVG